MQSCGSFAYTSFFRLYQPIRMLEEFPNKADFSLRPFDFHINVSDISRF